MLGRQERSFVVVKLAYIEEPAEFAVQEEFAASFHGHKCCSVTGASLVALALVWTRSLHYSASSELIWMMGRILARHSVADDLFVEWCPMHRSDIVADSFA